jgi:putative ubiquitin-RnfH superfamily antitoxin RatB of RatAB toxin-antitoxin module
MDNVNIIVSDVKKREELLNNEMHQTVHFIHKKIKNQTLSSVRVTIKFHRNVCGIYFTRVREEKK